MTKNRAFLIIGVGFLWLFGVGILGAAVASSGADELGGMLIWLALAGCSLMILVGMGLWAGAKGYHPIVGVALGFFCSLIGMLVLVFLPERNQAAGSEALGESVANGGGDQAAAEG